jgi:hypothetical protein
MDRHEAAHEKVPSNVAQFNNTTLERFACLFQKHQVNTATGSGTLCATRGIEKRGPAIKGLNLSEEQ